MTDPDSDWMVRYSRQILLPEIGGIGQKRLNAASVFLAGSGNVAESMLLYGVGAGIGGWFIMDGDDNRCETLQAAAYARNPGLRIEILAGDGLPPATDAVFADCSLLLDASGDPGIRQGLALAAKSLNLPCYSAWSTGFRGWVAQSPCPRCISLLDTPAATADDPVLSAMVPGLLGTILAQKAIMFLTAENVVPPPSELLRLNGASGDYALEELPTAPDCPECGN